MNRAAGKSLLHVPNQSETARAITAASLKAMRDGWERRTLPVPPGPTVWEDLIHKLTSIALLFHRDGAVDEYLRILKARNCIMDRVDSRSTCPKTGEPNPTY